MLTTYFLVPTQKLVISVHFYQDFDLLFFFYSTPVFGKKCNTFCSFKAEMSRVG